MKNKKIILNIITIISITMAGEFGGYSIFQYNESAFELKRVYLQYTDNLSENLFLKIRYDVGRDGDNADGKFETYLKNAYVDWEVKDLGKISLGLIGTNSYGIQESNWGYRFIEKSPLDLNKFTNTADLGIGISKNIGNFNISGQMLNGEGYKSESTDGNFVSYLRVVYGERKLRKNDGYNLGLVINNASDNDDYLMGVFGGWSENNIRIGGEYNIKETTIKESLSAVYMNYKRSNKLNIFLRHDIYEIEDVQGSEVTTTRLGIVINPTKGLFISPNIIIDNESGDNDYKLSFMFKY